MAEVAALVLAAGLGSRYRAAGGAEATKLVADYEGEPLVRRAVRAALASRARPVLVVTGHAREEVKAALDGLDVCLVHNPSFAEGLASSLRTGVAALPAKAVGAVALLGDMPEIEPALIDALTQCFLAAPGALAAIPTVDGKRGNPALLGRALFSRVAELHGDEGARGILRELRPDEIAELPRAGAGVTRDIDTPADLGLKFRVRDARPEDRASIVSAIVGLQDYERQFSDTRLPGAEVAEAYYDRLVEDARADGAMLVAEASGAFVGFAVGWIVQEDGICETPDSNRFGYVSDISVVEAYRGQRAAAALLEELEARLSSRGVARLRLNFLAANSSARAAYQRAGYRPYEELYEKRVGPQRP